MLCSPGSPGRRGGEAQKEEKKTVFIDGDGKRGVRARACVCGRGEGNERWELECN